MIKISKDEASYLRSHSSNIRIAVTGKGKNKRQKKRYVEATSESYRLLRRFAKEAR